MSALDRLNARQRRFVEGVASGMAAGRAYEAAGYRATGDTADQAASRLLSRNVKVATALAEVQSATPEIADRAERQRWWTRVFRGHEDADMRARLKASELLAKAGGDFVEKREIEHRGAVPVVVLPSNGREG